MHACVWVIVSELKRVCVCMHVCVGAAAWLFVACPVLKEYKEPPVGVKAQPPALQPSDEEIKGGGR